MQFGDVISIIQTCISAISLIISIVALGKVNNIKKNNNKQVVLGKENIQEIKN